jgi:hypothetical protein
MAVPGSAGAKGVLLRSLAYRLGGAVSERQWGDVVGVLRVQADRIDLAYLGAWAAKLGS